MNGFSKFVGAWSEQPRINIWNGFGQTSVSAMAISYTSTRCKCDNFSSLSSKGVAVDEATKLMKAAEIIGPAFQMSTANFERDSVGGFTLWVNSAWLVKLVSPFRSGTGEEINATQLTTEESTANGKDTFHFTLLISYLLYSETTSCCCRRLRRGGTVPICQWCRHT